MTPPGGKTAGCDRAEILRIGVTAIEAVQVAMQGGTRALSEDQVRALVAYVPYLQAKIAEISLHEHEDRLKASFILVHQAIYGRETLQ